MKGARKVKRNLHGAKPEGHKAVPVAGPKGSRRRAPHGAVSDQVPGKTTYNYGR